MKTKVKVEFEIEFNHDSSWSEDDLKKLARAHTYKPSEKYLPFLIGNPNKKSYDGISQTEIRIISSE